MSNPKISLSSPHMGGDEQKFIQEAFDNNWIAPNGPGIFSFENDIENYLENVNVTALNSGTAAIHLGLVLLGVKKGDEVLVQTHTHVASVNPIIYQGATPVFIDSEVDTWNLCPVFLEKAITDRISKGQKPKAIIAVHIYGIPYKIEAIRTVADKYNIPILEDSAEALGSSYKGQKCGTFGDIGILSFNGNKIITTSGGGALITKTKAEKEKAIFFATQSKDPAPYYQHSEIGYNYRMSTICASIGRGQMKVLNNHVVSRRAMHDFYLDLFENVEGITVFSVPNEDYYSNYWLTTILIDSEKNNTINRETIRLALEQENIESRPLWKPMHLQPIFKEYPYYGSNIAQSLFENGLCLPSGSNLTAMERAKIRRVVLKLYQR
ncbi:DegT/DnrJ/EryC1/StrS aminotransferase family protein [Flavobacterium sp. 123]|uniref:DegT/DnrJ/EryC1/StrS family aminotransferase n=1 Tax=Flavobacterium sp. 123 TaxID=2135627 RepID=UPI000EAC8DF3|nr:aminotransferase class I/II-fold pyridoxal phosphate-dependent enzyme [Flavobacterium sp. 123]RKT00004.1 dTDP-4-amino-4,6-dideoxygalactose transaminase [Flavobacterium sp. 123]